jgi:ectoine hydroxylase-related dioxygenase (phytanoyl-CoA dioxygenase family)
MIRRFKPAYWLYNFFRRPALAHNEEAYEKLGMKKRYFSSVSSADFADRDAEVLRPDRPPLPVTETRYYRGADEATRHSIDRFERDGYCRIEGFLDDAAVDTINATIDRLLETGEIDFTYRTKLMFAVRKAPELADLLEGEEWMEFLDALIGGEARLFQSINFLQGSQQRTHSDSIHMTTFPLGGLLGLWIALEDIDPAAGPLHYYPGSHHLPYFLNDDYDNRGGLLTIGDKEYTAYEDMIAEKLAASDYEKQVFLPRRGDLLIWHANLLHGGEPQTDPEKSRKSMVLHYFDVSRVCYHEITQRPALMG